MLLMMVGATCFAGPADRSVKKIVKTVKGEEVTVCPVGDEFFSYLQEVNGDRCFMKDTDNGEYVLIDDVFTENRRLTATQYRRQANKIRNGLSTVGQCEGERRILCVLVNFQDKSFDSGNVVSFEKILNKNRWTEGRYNGSVRDYFSDQSMGKFIPHFDIIGPLNLNNAAYYYGYNANGVLDVNHAEIATEIYAQLKGKVDFTLYDWNDRDEIDIPVCVVFAGLAEEVGGTENDIWCKASTALVDNNTTLHYALTSEKRMVNGLVMTNSIGTICHEMSHVFGLPDLYDGNSIYYGGQRWDVMSNGVHNDNGFTPAGYSSLDRMLMGWQKPIELTQNITVNNMEPLASGGSFYRVTNDAFPTEYYLIENRQKTNVWDASLPGTGVLIWHVDYNKFLFEWNTVNTSSNNPHERSALFLADNDKRTTTYAGDTYPYVGNNSLTNTSTPRASLWHPNIEGTYLMNKPITNIHCNANGIAGFTFENWVGTVPPAVQPNYIDNETPGLLAQYFFDYGITDLTLSGSVNSIDMWFMRKELTSLQRLDMRDCNVNNNQAGFDGTLQDQAFYNSTSLVEVLLPGLQSIGTWTFAYSPNLRRVVMQDGITTLPYCTFYQCPSLEEVVLPETLTRLDSYAFGSCTSLVSIHIPNSVHTIENSCFYKSSNLVRVDIPEMLEVLDNSTFRDCNLHEIILPEKVRELKYAVFWGNNNVEKVVCKNSTPPSCEDYAFSNDCYNKATLFVPKESIDEYRNAPTWKNFKDISTIDSYTSISELSGKSSVKSIRVIGRTIHLNASPESKVSIYGINGGYITEFPASVDSFELPHSGVYIISDEGKRTKVIVK